MSKLNAIIQQSYSNHTAIKRTTTSQPDFSNTEFIYKDNKPSRTPKANRIEEQKDAYSRIDAIMFQVENGPFYENFEITDKIMGIDSSGMFIVHLTFQLYSLSLNISLHSIFNS